MEPRQGASPAATDWVARAGGKIGYLELCGDLGGSFPYGHRSGKLYEMLMEIALDEDAAGRGLLSVVVMRAGRRREPRIGFFTAAEKRGRDVSAKQSPIEAELAGVYAQWGAGEKWSVMPSGTVGVNPHFRARRAE